MRIREFKDKNYKAVYINGKTMRFLCDNTKPMLELDYPEFYDVKITDKCNGKCPYCYQNSLPEGLGNEYDIMNIIKKYFGSMSMNERPLQIAIGGGETTLHPQFIDILKTVYELGITPNYTTNGMDISDDIIEATKKYCGGVAVTCHRHLEKYWRESFNKFYKNEIKTNFHIVISDKESIDYFLNIYKEYKSKVEYFVLLPYITMGRAIDKNIEYKYLFDKLDKIKDIGDIAFGAKFYEYKKWLDEHDVSLYEPEIMSKYLDMVNMKIYNSSFEKDPIGDIK